jgi:hypothetical protein
MASPPPLGPFVGAAGSGSVRLVLALPGRDEGLLRCRLEPDGGEARELEAEASHGVFRSFVFPFDGLEPGAWCSYSFATDAGPLDLQGLTAEDCRFRAPGPFGPEDSFLLVSCHRPDAELEGSNSEERTWERWRELRSLLDADEGVRLLLLGGDQLYNDALEEEHLPGLDEEDAPRLREGFIASYRKHWGHLDYRRALARVPSTCTWDDHDITDGWGSRPEQFDGDEIREDWLRYFGVAREAAAAYQFSRNPAPLLRGEGAPRSTALDLGDDRFLLLDLRSERNSRRKQLWSTGHEAAAFASIESAPGRLFALSPVAAFRTNPGQDSRLGRLARLLFSTTRWWQVRRWLRRSWLLGMPLLAVSLVFAGPALPLLAGLLALWTMAGGVPELMIRVPFLPHLTDDLEDGLTSPSNRESLRRLLDALLARRRRGPVALLGGDVHLQGLSELIDAREQPRVAITQVVSSPISNRPLEKVAAGFTTTSSPILPDEAQPLLFARNLAWFSRRGFVQLTPAAFESGAQGPAIRFHLEDHEEPLAFPASFLGPSQRKG